MARRIRLPLLLERYLSAMLLSDAQRHRASIGCTDARHESVPNPLAPKRSSSPSLRTSTGTTLQACSQ